MYKIIEADALRAHDRDPGEQHTLSPPHASGLFVSEMDGGVRVLDKLLFGVI